MLHGEIKVNGTDICEWWAVRKNQVFPPGRENDGTFFRYECGVRYRDIQGYPNEAEFDVKHRFGDGALLLAAQVVKVGYGRAKRVPPETVTYGSARANAIREGWVVPGDA